MKFDFLNSGPKLPPLLPSLILCLSDLLFGFDFAVFFGAFWKEGLNMCLYGPSVSPGFKLVDFFALGYSVCAALSVVRATHSLGWLACSSGCKYCTALLLVPGTLDNLEK